jgi:hypothetical protein
MFRITFNNKISGAGLLLVVEIPLLPDFPLVFAVEEVVTVPGAGE